MRSWSFWLAAAFSCAVAVVALAGCSEPSGGDPDGGTPLDASEDPAFTVASPATPLLTPCLEGWQARDVAGISVCEPWATGEPRCAAGQARFPGTASCAPVGVACPVGPFADDLPTDGAVLYVQPGLSVEGDGTRDSPFATIDRALSAAGTGAIIALGKGTVGPVTLPAGVQLIGACSAESRLVAPTSSDTLGVVTVAGDGVVVRNVGLTGERSGVVVEAGSIALDGVVIEAARDFGISVKSGASLTGQNVAVSGTRDRASTGDSGAGVGVFGGASVELTRAVIEGNLATGIWAGGAGTRATLTAVAIVGTLAQGDGRFGQGLDVSEGASVTLVGSVIESNVSGGITLTNTGTTLELRDSVVRDSTRSRDGRLGRGISVAEGARCIVERVLVTGNAEAGMFALGADSAIDATHLVVTDTDGADGDAIDGFGLGLEDDASAEIRQAVFSDNQTAGISTRDGTTMTLADVVVRDTRGRALDGALGQGIHLEGGAHIERVLAERNRQVGLIIIGDRADVVATDLMIRGTRAQASDGLFGRGLYAGDGSHAQIARLLVDDNQETGIGADGAGTTLALESVTVRATWGEEASGQFGVGLVAQNGATVTLVSGRFAGNREVGISSRGAGTLVDLTDVEVTGTLERACVATTCASAGLGVGLGAYTNGQLTASTFLVDGNALVGVQLAEGGTMDLSDGVVSSNPIGANIQTAGYDAARINDRVLYRDNGRNLDSSLLSIPAPSTGL